MGRRDFVDSIQREQLETVVELLGKLASGTEYPDEQACMRIVLREGAVVDIWQSSNDPGFKWAHVPD